MLFFLGGGGSCAYSLIIKNKCLLSTFHEPVKLVLPVPNQVYVLTINKLHQTEHKVFLSSACKHLMDSKDYSKYYVSVSEIDNLIH